MMKEKFEAVKNHLIKHKETYIASVATAIVTGLSVYAWTRLGEDNVDISSFAGTNVVPITKNSAVIQTNNTLFQTISMYGNPIGRPGKPVFDMETGKRFESETLAAKAIGVSPVMMSNHLNGKTDDIDGRTFKFVTDVA